jgi:hypothetical protein
MASYMQHASSSGFLGESVPHAGAFIENLDSKGLIETAVATALVQANTSLRKQLEADPRWKPFAESIEIKWEDEEFTYVIDSEDETVEQAIYLLEYGDGETGAPTGMLRKHAFRMGRETSKAVEAAVNKSLGLKDDHQNAAEAYYGL